MTPHSTQPKRAFQLTPWQVVLAFCLIYLTIIFVRGGGDPKTFVTLGTCWSDCADRRTCPAGTTNGYDGQFAYYIARDPANANLCLDVPAYRYQRIGLPLAGRILALGQEDWIPLAFVVLNLTVLVGSTAMLTELLTEQNVSRWYALVYGLFVGMVIGVRLSTTEPLAYSLVVAALWLGRHQRYGLEALALLLAALTKEMALVFVAGYLLYDVLVGGWRHALRLVLVVGLPVVLWQLALYGRFGRFGAGSGGAGNSPFEIIPFNGFWRIAYDPSGSPAAFFFLGLTIFPSTVLPSVWSLWATVRDLRRHKVHLYTCLLLANAALMAFVPFSTYREPLGIFRFIVGLVLSYILYVALCYPGQRPLRYSPLWLALSYYLLAG